MNVLFVGNDREIIRMTGKILQKNHYDTFCAAGIDETERILNQEHISLVIVDCDMRRSERDDICKTIKQRENPPLLIMLSEDAEDEVPLLRSGADEWIKKPYKMDVLLARMSSLLRRETNKGGKTL